MDSTTLIGLTLDNYRLDHLLGRGGMGVVYKARDLATSRDVAVKVLGPGNGPGTDAAERFQREALWLSQCDDPHIVSVYATGRADGIDYIAMELMSSTLQDRMDGHRPDLSELVQIGSDILLGLAAAHRMGIIHRDIKPANVGITQDGTVKLLDFGVANPLPWSSHVQETPTSVANLVCIGSLHYMPPEQLRGQAADERADIYSTGAVLYELATGQQPFPHVHPVCLIDAILNDPPLPPSALNPCVAALDEVVLRALAKRPTARFQSVPAMTDALLRLRSKRRQTKQKQYGVPAYAAVSSGAFPQGCDDSSRLARASCTAVFRAATGPGVDGVAACARARRRRRGNESPS